MIGWMTAAVAGGVVAQDDRCIDLRGPEVETVVHVAGTRFDGPRTSVKARRLEVGTQPLPFYQPPDDVDSTFAAPFIEQLRIVDTVTVPPEGLGMAFSIDPNTSFAVGESGQHNLEALRHRLDALGLENTHILRVSVAHIDADDRPDLHGVIAHPDHAEQVVLWGSGGETRWTTELYGSTVPILSAEPLFRIPSMPGWLVTTGACCGGFWANRIPVERGLVTTTHHSSDDQTGICLTPDGALHDRPEPNAR